jgi:hypothetical protein
MTNRMTQGSLQNTLRDRPSRTTTAGRRILRRADSHLPLLADSAGQIWSLPATGLLGQVDSEGEPKIGPAVDDGAEAAA